MTARYHQLATGETEALKKEYLNHLYRRNVWSIFQSVEEGQFNGKILDIDGIGRLNIQKENGQIQSFSFREVSFIL